MHKNLLNRELMITVVVISTVLTLLIWGAFNGMSYLLDQRTAEAVETRVGGDVAGYIVEDDGQQTLAFGQHDALRCEGGEVVSVTNRLRANATDAQLTTICGHIRARVMPID